MNVPECDNEKKQNVLSWWPSYSKSYHLMIFSFLLIFSVLPAVSLLQVIYQKEITTIVQHELLQLSKKLEGVEKPLEDREELLARVKVGKDQKESVLKESDIKRLEIKELNKIYGFLGFYPDFLTDSTWELIVKNNTQVNNEKSSVFDELYQLISTPFVPLRKGIDNWGFIRNTGTADSRWTITDSRVSLNRDLGTQAKIRYSEIDESIKKDNNYIVLASAKLDAYFSFLGIKWLGLKAIFLILVFIAVIYKLSQFVLERVVFLNREETLSRLDEDMSEAYLFSPMRRGLMIIGYPCQGKTRQIKELLYKDKTRDNEEEQKKKIIYINLQQERQNDWEQVIEDKMQGVSSPVIVMVDQFDYRCNEADINRKKLEFIEWLIFSTCNEDKDGMDRMSRKLFENIHIISNVNPDVFPLSQDDTAGCEYRARWNILWAEFRRVYYGSEFCISSIHESKNDAEEKRKSITKIGAHSYQSHYRAIWQSLTTDEQLALFHLARDRFVHYKHPGLYSLLGKGLIEFSPDLCLKEDLYLRDKNFNNFVIYAGERSNLTTRERPRETGNWVMFKYFLITGCVGLFLYLLVTQKDFQTMLPALASLLPLLLQGMPDLFSGISKGLGSAQQSQSSE